MLLKTVTLQSYTTQSTNGAHLPQSVYLPAHVWGSDGVPLPVWLHLLALLPQQAQLPITVMQPLGSGQRHVVMINTQVTVKEWSDDSHPCYAMGEVLGIESIHLRVRHHDELLQTCWVSKIHWYVLLLLHWFSAINVLHRVHYGTYCMRGWLRGIYSRGKAEWCICLETPPWVHKIPWCAYTFYDPIICWAKYTTLCTLWKSALLSYVYSSETANTWPYVVAGGWSKTSWGLLWG